MKKTDINLSLVSNNILYKPSFNEIEKEIYKIKNAILCIKFSNDVICDSENILVYYNQDNILYVIDSFKKSTNNNINIDITDELVDYLKQNSNNELKFQLKNLPDGTIIENLKVVINYNYKNIYNNKSKYLELYGKKAGNGLLNLENGEFLLNNKISTLSKNFMNLNLIVTYNPICNKILKNYKLDDFNLSSHWKLNLQQFLIVNDYNEVPNEENENLDSTYLNYTYVDDNGFYNNFIEKYYYLDADNKKIFLNKSKVNVDLYGNLFYSDSNNNYEVKKDISTDSGLTLIPSIKDFLGYELINYEPEELMKIEEQIEQLENSKKEYYENKKLTLEQLIILCLSNQEEEIEKSLNDESINQEEETGSKSIDKQHHYIEIIKNALDADFFKNNSDDINCFINNHIEYLDNLNNLTNVFQIEQCINNIEKYESNIKEIDENIENLVKQKNYYQKQTPIHYIKDSEGTIMGFAKTDVCNVYRLITISDSYENTLYLHYENNKLTSIISNEQEIKFEYKNNSLISIKDEFNKIIKFNYDENNNLESITYPNGRYSYYCYNKNRLEKVKDSKNFGFKLEYLNNQVTKISTLINDKTCDKEDEFEINYYDYKTTIVSNLKNNKTTTYNFDNNGNIVTIYSNKFEDGEVVGNVNVTSYDTNTDNISFIINSNPYAKELLNEINLNASKIMESDNYLSDDTELETDLYLTNYLTPKNLTNNILVFKNGSSKMEMEISANSLKDDNGIINETDYILSGWAKANSAFVYRRCTSYSKDNVEENLNKNEFVDLVEETTNKNRRFELRAELYYLDESIEEQYCSFDWMNTNWQYCAFPVTINENKKDLLKSIKLIFDYSENIFTTYVKFYNMNLKCGNWEYIEYNDNKLKTYYENNKSNQHVTYNYDENNLLVNETLFIDSNEFKTNYEYDIHNNLVKIEDYNGIIRENIFNDKGILLKSYIYHKYEPSSKLYDENMINDRGQEIGRYNEFGEELCKYVYDEKGKIISEIDYKGNKMSYNYLDGVMEISKTAKGISNTNSVIYDLDLIKTMRHNNFEINYEYDYLDRVVKIFIGETLYLSKEYQPNYEIVTINRLDNIKEIYKKYFDEDDNLINIYYTKIEDGINLINEKLILENIYDTFGSLIQTKTYINDNTISKTISLNNYGDISKEEIIINDTTEQLSKVILENIYNNKRDKIISKLLDINDEKMIYNYIYSNLPKENLEKIILTNNIQENLFEQNISYDKLDRISKIETNLLEKEYTYLKIGDHTSSLITNLSFRQDNKISERLNYKYDSNGNIIEIRENNKLITRYSYDCLSRIIREDNKLLNKTFSFDYDSGGNIISKTEYDFTLIDNLDYENGTSINFSYSTKEWKDQLISYDNEELKYDNFGNPIIYRNKPLEWEYSKLLTKYDNKVFYKYNGNGIRISKTFDNVTTFYHLDGNKILKQEDSNGNNITFYYGVDGVIGFNFKNLSNDIDKTYFYKKNIQNDIIGILNSENKLICKYEYDAWGNHTTKYLGNDDNFIAIYENLVYNYIDNTDKLIALINPFRYRSYYYDIETGLYYCNSRYYDSEIGRFISPDSVDYLDTESINGLNLYAYCGNDPVMYSDGSGYAPWWSLALSGLQLLGGIALCIVPGMQGLGASLAIGGVAGLIMNALEPQIAQAIGGIGSMVNGYGAISTGANLMSLGGWASIVGIGLILIGAGTMAFGANEVVDTFTGTNYIQEWTGISDNAYAWSYLGLNLASFIGTGLGQRYVQVRSRTAIYNPDGSVKQYRYYKNGSKLYDVDFNHAGKMKFPHYHGWLRNGTRLGKNHPGYIIMLLQLFGRIFR